MTGCLVSAQELAGHVGDPAWRVFDCRHDLRDTAYGEKAYAKEHIPGALFLHLDRDLSGPTTGKNGRHPLPDPQVFAARMAACGVGPDTQVVAYDNEGNAFAARLWWLLRWIGHEKVAVLDGGLAGWRRAKQPLNAEVPGYPAASLPVRPSQPIVDADFVQGQLGKPEMLLLDARTEERFAGQNETLDPVGGHIPGAVNRFFMDNLDDAGVYFKPVDELRADFDALLAGRSPESVVQQCGSGVTACHNILAMEAAGLKGSRLYPGSWSEWCADPSRPVATGP
ncbi:MAG TPA: sulfurtransferase [Rhodocyclaceae bacterium]